MSDLPLLSTLSADQLLRRAEEYRSMALSASTLAVRDALDRTAARFEHMATMRSAPPAH